jgi:LuxR family maltose regulon positive regulatory protein
MSEIVGESAAGRPRVVAASLAAKLAPPRASGYEIDRASLSCKIVDAATARLTLLRAPAGFGKTTLMLDIRARFEAGGVRTAWLTMDASDNDVGRFLAALAAALSPIIPALESKSQGGEEEAALALSVIDAIGAHDYAFALFLDDFEAAQGATTQALVREIIRRLPPAGRIVIGSRVVPDVGLGRLRVTGGLIEIEPRQFRFTLDEAQIYLRDRRGLSLSTGDVARLHRSTEGWAAALWIAAVSLADREEPSRFIDSFTGSNGAIVDYLLEDVLARLDDDTRRFLLRTSIAGDLVPSLCDRLCGSSDSLERLERMERENLFLVPVQGGEARWRYHSMFGEFLRGQLARQLPQEVRTLHSAAADWYLDQDREVPAIEHRLAAGDAEGAVELLGRHAEPLLMRGRLRLLARWFDGLDAAGRLTATPDLQAAHGWSVLLSRGPRAAEPLIARLETLERPSVLVEAHRRALRMMYLVLLDRTEEANEIGVELMRNLPPRVPFVRGFVEIALANLAVIAGQYKTAMRLVEAVRSREPENTGDFIQALSQSAEGALDLTQGRLRKAIAHLRLAFRSGVEGAPGVSNGNALAGVLLAEALYEADEPDQAERMLTVCIPLIRAVGIPDQLILAHTIMARIAARRGDFSAAEQWLAELEMTGHREGLARVVANARLERARMLIVRGRLDEGRFEIERCANPALWDRIDRLSLRANEVETYAIGYCRWAARGPKPEAAIGRLRVQAEAAERTQRARRALTLRLILAQAQDQAGARNKAMRTLKRALEFAAAEGYYAAVRDEGPQLLALVAAFRDSGEFALAPDEPALTRFLQILLKEAPAPGPSADPAAPPPDALTHKERRILALAAEGLTNAQLAKRLFVAETTVRTHLRSVNAKLNARSRTQAVAIARRYGWLG